MNNLVVKRKSIFRLTMCSLLFLFPFSYAGDGACDSGFAKSSQGQIGKFCKAADTAEKTKKAETISTSLWAVTSATCGTACGVCLGADKINPTPWCQGLIYGCTGASLASTVTDIVQAKKLEQAGINIAAGAGASAAAGGAAVVNAGAGAAPIPYAPGTTLGPSTVTKALVCASAGLAVVNTVMHGMGIKKAKDKKEENEKEAEKFLSEAQSALAGAGIGGGALGSGGGGGGTTAALTSALTKTGVTREQGQVKNNNKNSVHVSALTDLSHPVDQCLGQKSSGNIQGYIKCARGIDPTLPSFLSDKKFQKAFEESSGYNFEQFIAKINENTTPDQIIYAAMKKHIPQVSQAHLRSQFVAIEKDMESYPDAYASLFQKNVNYSSSLLSNQGEPPASPYSVSSTLDSQPKNEYQLVPSSESSLAKREIASQSSDEQLFDQPEEDIFKNRAHNIFQRVSHRYEKMKPRLTQKPWASPYNRAANAQ